MNRRFTTNAHHHSATALACGVALVIIFVYRPALSDEFDSKTGNAHADSLALIEESTTPLEDALSGLIIDRTITHIGHEFYREFTAYRYAQQSESTDNLIITERPSARWGSLITVTYNSSDVFRAFLQPGRNNLKDAAEAAAIHVGEAVKQRKLLELFTDTFDVERDEL